MQAESLWRRNLRYEVRGSIEQLRESRQEVFWAAMLCLGITISPSAWAEAFFGALAVVGLLVAAWAQWNIIGGKKLLRRRE